MIDLHKFDILYQGGGKV